MSNSGASGILPVGVVCVMIRLLSTTWVHFPSFPLLHTGREGYTEASTTSNNTNLMSSCAVMVDNLAEKVNECPLNRGRWVLLANDWDRENCPLYTE